MTFDDIPKGATVFADANVLLFALAHDPIHGAACEAFLDRSENQEISVVTSAHVLGEVVHRLMTIEACERFGWPVAGSANRLRRHPAEVQQLTRAEPALDEINAARVAVLPIAPPLVSLA